MQNTELLRYNFRLSKVQVQALRKIRRTSDIPVAEQIRRAIDAYLRTANRRVRAR